MLARVFARPQAGLLAARCTKSRAPECCHLDHGTGPGIQASFRTVGVPEAPANPKGLGDIGFRFSF